MLIQCLKGSDTRGILLLRSYNLGEIKFLPSPLILRNNYVNASAVLILRTPS